VEFVPPLRGVVKKGNASKFGVLCGYNTTALVVNVAGIYLFHPDALNQRGGHHRRLRPGGLRATVPESTQRQQRAAKESPTAL
jgi:hypothetical protein